MIDFAISYFTTFFYSVIFSSFTKQYEKVFIGYYLVTCLLFVVSGGDLTETTGEFFLWKPVYCLLNTYLTACINYYISDRHMIYTFSDFLSYYPIQTGIYFAIFIMMFISFDMIGGEYMLTATIVTCVLLILFVMALYSFYQSSVQTDDMISGSLFSSMAHFKTFFFTLTVSMILGSFPLAMTAADFVKPSDRVFVGLGASLGLFMVLIYVVCTTTYRRYKERNSPVNVNKIK